VGNESLKKFSKKSFNLKNLFYVNLLKRKRSFKNTTHLFKQNERKVLEKILMKNEFKSKFKFFKGLIITLRIEIFRILRLSFFVNGD